MIAAAPLSLYVHIPWCVRKCPYCDFNSHNAPRALPQDAYVDALLADLDQEVGLAQGRPIESIFFGGGTPSLFAPEAIARILDGVAQRLKLAANAEITMEANPGTVEYGRMDGYLRAGVNRVSFGIQSFDDAALRRIGRIHDAMQAERAVKSAQDAGIGNLNLDLMYALPEQSLAGAVLDVEKALALAPQHISHYHLTIEPNTPFARQPPPLPDEDSAWDMQEACQARLAAAGFDHYETSAYAQSGRRCRHNLNYWSFGDYLGIGAGAHGKVTDPVSGEVSRYWKLKNPSSYLAAAGTAARLGGLAAIDAEQLPFEFMLNALRLDDGFSLADFETRTGLPRARIATPLAQAAARGWLSEDAQRLRPTPLGQRFQNDVIGLFMA